MFAEFNYSFIILYSVHLNHREKAIELRGSYRIFRFGTLEVLLKFRMGWAMYS